MNKIKYKYIILSIVAMICLIALTVIIYPNIEFKKDGKLYACRFSDDFSEFEQNPSVNEQYFYNEKHDVSLKTFNVKNFLCFYLFTFDYVEGDARKTMFVLDEEFINYWLENAQIEENSDNVDIRKLIEGKSAIVGNKRYSNENDDGKYIFYKLDGKWDEMCVFESEGLLVIRIGSVDESPKYIAYK